MEVRLLVVVKQKFWTNATNSTNIRMAKFYTDQSYAQYNVYVHLDAAYFKSYEFGYRGLI